MGSSEPPKFKPRTVAFLGSFGHAIPVPEMENETGGSIPCDLFVVMARANQLKIVRVALRKRINKHPHLLCILPVELAHPHLLDLLTVPGLARKSITGIRE